ncbi:phosphoribosyltransferase domain-containing protein [Nocardioides carbamazepini]|uniref:phosphoribosyltransferase n=1 Tax=Nocardioides carbamazepini TaxID=2854259 RepID=UPI00214A199E|nr:phosphoribosyltransferase [Nocardioides carbamazepini]MCR1786712.1 phosphoribosyltransferase domain-containing protein [Nocardioides carbamazepini]
MRLSVADLDSSDDDPQSFRIACPGGLTDETGSILYIPLPAAQRMRGIDDVIAALPAWSLVNHLTVIGVHPWRRDALDSDALGDIASRVSGAPLYVLCHDADGNPALEHVRGEKIEGLNEADLIAELRHADVNSVLMTDGAHLPHTAKLHYQGPNGHHYGALLRPGFALTTNNRLDRIAFWLAKDVRDRTNIVVDHWSMIALAHHVAAYAARTFKTNPEPFIEAVSGYESRETLAPRLRRVFPQPTQGQAMFLLSINSSGAMAHEVVLPALEEAAQRGATAVALATSSAEGDRDVPALAVLDEQFRRHPADACPRCADDTTVIPIQKNTYLMKLAAYTELSAITAKDAERSRDVVEAYAASGAFSLHRDYDEAGEERHHAFYVDLLPMLSTDRFNERLRSAVESLEHINPQVIICPPSQAAQELAAKVADLIGLPAPIVSDERGLSTLPPEQSELLCADVDILLVDDVVITGRRIEAFRQELIRLRRSRDLPSEFNLGCLVGVARARDPRALKGCMDFVHHRQANKTFAAVETLFLPNWNERKCPWCRELQALTALTGPSRDLPVVETRVAQLFERDGLAEPFFNVSGDDEAASGAGVPGDELAWQKLSEEEKSTKGYAKRFWELNPGSVFGDVQGVNLVISIAAAVQKLRFKYDYDQAPVEPGLDARFRSPIAKVLDPSLYMFGRFYEPVLLASILRVCNPWDLSSPEVDDDLVEGVEQHLNYLSSGEYLMGEAIILGRLERLPARAVKALPEAGTHLAELASALLP